MTKRKVDTQSGVVVVVGEDRIEKLLHRLYYDTRSASAFSGKENVYRVAKRHLPSITRRLVNEWFENQLTYTLHKPIRHNFQRNKTVVMSIDDQWQADLCDMSSRAKDNNGYTFLLTVIDCFSKFGWAEPLRNKSSQEILDAFKRILKRDGRKPKRLQTDKGTEFLNSKFQRFLKEENIEFFTTNSEMKASIVERYNRSVKMKMHKFFTAHNTPRYVDVLQDLIDGYNDSHHRSIGMTPSSVLPKHHFEIRQRLYGLPKKQKPRRRPPPPPPRRRRPSSKKYKYAIGDVVRISKAQRVFRKGYLPNWTEETFTVYDRQSRKEPIYRLRDYGGENIKGGFYEKELQRVKEQDEYRIEKVLRTKKVKGGKTLYLVKWKGWSEKFNSWVEDIRAL